MSETTAFANVANIVGGYAFKGAELGTTGFPVIKIAEITPPRIDVESAERIPFEKVHGLDRFKLGDGDILMAMTGATTGKVGRLRYTEPAYLNQRVARITAKAGRDFDDYVWAIVSQPRFEELVLANAHGSAQPNVSSDGIGRIQIVKLPENAQIEIGHVARSLDDKIEQNRRTGRKLEALARAVFKAWFVDFEPVKAKAAGATAFPGMPPETFATLPNTLKHSPLGPVPEGWEVGTFGTLCIVGRGSSPRPINDFMGGTVPWLKIADATAANGPFLYETQEFVTEAGATKSVPVVPGDLILSNSASCGIPIFVGLNGCIHDGWLHFRDLQRISKGYLYHWLQWKSSHLIHIADGSVQKNLNTKLIRELPIVIPSVGLHDSFAQLNDSIFKLIDAVGRESLRLATLRDYLLPRLLSGRVRVREATTVKLRKDS